MGLGASSHDCQPDAGCRRMRAKREKRATMAEPSFWRRAFDRIENPTARVLESAVRSSGFALVLTEALRLERSAARRARATSTGILHLFDLPAHSDLVALSKRLARLEAEIRSRQTEL
jgi:hypothetical protein